MGKTGQNNLKMDQNNQKVCKNGKKWAKQCTTLTKNG